jgi:Holliday junction resolvase RusA-like endonuclease
VTRSLDIEFPWLPPSENHIRVHRWQGGEMYSKEAEAYRTEFKAWVQKHHFALVQRFVRGHQPTSAYRVILTLVFETLVNKGWVEKNRAGERKVKSPYKKVDAANRDKLLLDCLVESLGIDDALSMELFIVKRMDPENPGVKITIEEVNPLEYGIPPEYLD